MLIMKVKTLLILILAAQKGQMRFRIYFHIEYEIENAFDFELKMHSFLK